MRAIRGLAGVLVMAFLILALSLQAAFAAAVGRFTVVRGKVDILKSGEVRASAVNVGDPVSPGDIVRAKSISFAEVVFADNTVLKLAPNTRVEIKDYTLADDNTRKAGTLRLMRGKLRATVPKMLGAVLPITAGQSNFQVETPTAIAGVRGTDFFMFYLLGLSGVLVQDGIVDTLNKSLPDDIVRVLAGSFTMIRPDGPPSAPSMMRGFERARLERDTSGPGAGDREEGEGPAAGFSEPLFEAVDTHEDLGGAPGGRGSLDTLVTERPDRPITETEPDTTLGETGKRGDFVRIN
ncbi:MAG: FecR domain-containing protein [Deltaproteobacteria bacterium]|nr:FecR domain-containing protein [Deltaproteobacteria bacterium]